MKKAILILGGALLLAGCNKEQGGTTDQYGTDRGTTTGTVSNNAPSSSTFATNSSSFSSTNEVKTNSSSNP